MKSIPSASLLLDPFKREFIDRILTDVNMNLQQYIDTIINRTVVKPKQILTDLGLQLLNQPEHNVLRSELTKRYPLFMTKGTDSSYSTTPLINQNFLRQFVNLHRPSHFQQTELLTSSPLLQLRQFLHDPKQVIINVLEICFSYRSDCS